MTLKIILDFMTRSNGITYFQHYIKMINNYYENNKEQIKKNRLIRYYKNKGIESKRMKAYRLNNLFKLKNYYKLWKTKNIIKLKNYKKQYRKENKEVINIQNRLREKRLRNVIIKYSVDEWLSMKYSTNGICPCCNNKVGLNKITLDHIIPISKAPKGMIYAINKIQALCLKCNLSKGIN